MFGLSEYDSGVLYGVLKTFERIAAATERIAAELERQGSLNDGPELVDLLRQANERNEKRMALENAALFGNMTPATKA